MMISDYSIKRPVFAAVMSLLIIVFGVVSFLKLPLREYPDTDPPVVSITTKYQGASASIVETRITQLLEDRVAGIEGVRFISSSSQDGRSQISIEFDISRNIDDATNDVRDRVSGVINNLPNEADPPEIEKASSDDDVIIWLNFNSKNMSVMEITDYARRYLQDQFSALDGVARVRIGGSKEKAMRIWLDRKELAARALTVGDIEQALLRENVELPAGQIQSIMKDFTVRVDRAYNTPQDFEKLVIVQGEEGYLVRLGDVARVKIAPVEERGFFRGNGEPMVGIGIIKQSTANTLDVANRVKAKMKVVNQQLPEGMTLDQSYDTSIFIQNSIDEVYKTLFIAITLVILVIYLFLGNVRAMLIPAVTVPVSLIATFIILWIFGYTINLLTLLALVLAIGLIVDDAIVVLENIHRRLEKGEPPLLAAFRGGRQVGFAVIATTLVLVAVFIPITFLEGDVGRLFSEFAVAMVAAVIFSSFVALTLCTALASRIMKQHAKKNILSVYLDKVIEKTTACYSSSLKFLLSHPMIVVISFVVIIGSTVLILKKVPGEFVPKEDRGVIFMIVSAPEGSSYEFTSSYMEEIEARLMPFVDSQEFHRLLIRAPRSLSSTQNFSGGIGIIVLKHWDTGRKPVWHYVSEIRRLTQDLSGVKIFPVVRQGLSRGLGKPVEFVLGGSSYEELAKWRDILLEKASENPNLLELDHDYKETKPQVAIRIEKDRAGDLGVSLIDINKTLETMLGSRHVTTFIERGEEYDVILEGESSLQKTALDMKNIYVRSNKSETLIPLSNLITYRDFADAASLNRYNRLRSITIEANLAEGYSLEEALIYLNALAKEHLPSDAIINYKGQSLDYTETGSSIYFIFLLSLVIVYLVMAALFESFVHPFVIMFSVPLAVFGALVGLWLTGQTLNIYSQIGLIMLVGLAAKNGILIVEFINQLRDQGVAFKDAIIEATQIRFRPIVMTAITTIMGSLPLIYSMGAGKETRYVLGIVIFFGVLMMTFLTLYFIPVIYQLLAKNTKPPHEVDQVLHEQLEQYKDNV